MVFKKFQVVSLFSFSLFVCLFVFFTSVYCGVLVD